MKFCQEKRRREKLLQDLRGLISGEDVFRDWMAAPNPVFDNCSPEQLVAAGEFDRLEKMIMELRVGGYR